MATSDENGMWNIVLFDLPVLTKTQRREATKFRKLLIDLGWVMEQYSVYVRYVPTGMSVVPEIQVMKKNLPGKGRVEIVSVTDRQWSKAIRFLNEKPENPPEPPAQLTIF